LCWNGHINTLCSGNQRPFAPGGWLFDFTGFRRNFCRNPLFKIEELCFLTIKTCFMNKSKVVLLLVAAFLSTAVYSQGNSSANAPQQVTKAFKAKFPTAANVSWVKEPNSNYEAKFKMGDVKQRAEFDTKGNWVETENSIKTSTLPKTVTDEVKKQNSGCKITEAEEVETAGSGKVYDVGCMVNSAKKEYRVTADGATEKEIVKK
jgi:hypothetical protein